MISDSQSVVMESGEERKKCLWRVEAAVMIKKILTKGEHLP